MAFRRRPNERKLGDSPAELADGERVPFAAEDLRRIPRIKMRYVTIFIFGLIGIGFIKGQQTISITKSCTTADFAVENSALQNHSLTKFTMTGPDASYVLGINLAGIKVKADGSFQLIPKDGRVAGQFQLGGKVQEVKKCIAHSLFAVNVQAGSYEIEMFRFPVQGTAGDAQLVAARIVEIGAEKKR